MYKPTSPKSAKGKIRAPRSPAQRSVTQNQRQDPGTENKLHCMVSDAGRGCSIHTKECFMNGMKPNYS
ncbi:unnamed protein product [Clavelina lepadiformis]|uniref:Uncharacterized protein n=1 Tax=Clavelina lepadiformis TaxID=159417 RepID=A0ABP0GF81_CLALP